MPELVLSLDEYLATLHREGDLFAVAVASGDLDATVPTCPEWTLRELAHHLGRVHHWAAATIEQRRAAPLDDEGQRAAWGDMPGDGEVVAWYRGARDRVVSALAAAPADLAVWTFLADPPAPRVFWARRQSHELAIHRVDAQGTVGAVDPVAPAFAVDGIDELLLGFHARARSRVRADTPATLSLRTEVVSWLVHIGPDSARTERTEAAGDCTVRGSASDIYYALWNRLPFENLDVEGDQGLVELWSRKAKILWS